MNSGEEAVSFLTALAPHSQNRNSLGGKQAVKDPKDFPFEAFDPVTEIPPLLSGGKALTPFPLADDLKSILEECKKEMGKASRLMALWKKYANSTPTVQKQNVLLRIISELLASQKEVARCLTEVARLLAVAAADPGGLDGAFVDKDQGNPLEGAMRDWIEVTRRWKEQRNSLEEVTRDLIEAVRRWEDQRASFLAALEAGNLEPFFEALKHLGGAMVFDPCISQVIQEKMLSAPVEEKDRTFLVRLKKEINFVGSGPMPQLELESQHTARLSKKSKSAAVTRLVKKYKKWLGPPFNLNSDDARRQAEEDFQKTTKIPKNFKQEVLLSFRKKIKDNRDRQS